MIQIHPSPTADTRSCDPATVTQRQLLSSSLQHIADVGKALAFLSGILTEKASVHDYDKLTEIDWFHRNFATGFKETGWWDNHRRIHRHHLAQEDGVPKDVNLLDVLEYIADCVMAGKARTGEIYPLKFTPELLGCAFENTVALLSANVEVVPPPEKEVATLTPLTGEWTTRCTACGKEYQNGCGSSECCGALQEVTDTRPSGVSIETRPDNEKTREEDNESDRQIAEEVSKE